MIETYSHKSVNSFYLWFDNALLNKLQAYKTVSSSLYSTNDSRINSNFNPYSSPFKQWVYDLGVAGAYVPSGVSGVSGFMGRSQIKLDFDNGRVLLNSGLGKNQPLSGTYSIKDLNVYVTKPKEISALLDSAYQLNSRYGIVPQSGVNPYGVVLPACFIMNMSSENKPFAFGGEEDTKTKFRVVTITDQGFHLDGCQSLFRDLSNSIVPIISLSGSQFDAYGDLKDTSFNYNVLAQANMGHYMFLEKVTTLKFVDAKGSVMNPNLVIGVMDFYFSDPRFPKLEV